MNTFLIYLFILGLVMFIFGIVILYVPSAVKGLGFFMLISGGLCIGGLWGLSSHLGYMN
jgi:hypothetical protein